MWLRSMPGNDTALKPIVHALMSPAFPVLILMVFLAVGFWLRSGLIEEDSRHVRIIFGSLFLLGLLTSLTTVLVQAILRRNQALLKTRKDLEREIDQRKAVQTDLERLESTDTSPAWPTAASLWKTWPIPSALPTGRCARQR